MQQMRLIHPMYEKETIRAMYSLVFSICSIIGGFAPLINRILQKRFDVVSYVYQFTC